MDFSVECVEANNGKLLDNTNAIGVVFFIHTIIGLLMASF